MPARWRQPGIKNKGVHTDEADWADALIAPGALHLPRATTKKLLLDLRLESDRRQKRSGSYSPIRVIRDAPLGS